MNVFPSFSDAIVFIPGQPMPSFDWNQRETHKEPKTSMLDQDRGTIHIICEEGGYYGYGNPDLTCRISCRAVAYPIDFNWDDGDYRPSSVQGYLSPVEIVRSGWLTLAEHQYNLTVHMGHIVCSCKPRVHRIWTTAHEEEITACGSIQAYSFPVLLHIFGVSGSDVLGHRFQNGRQNLQGQTIPWH
ncbi:uncharacterized protein EV420DRAFT_1484881 [Desarmillaria tabescens]|uniref:Uncharacterized protein n=1 Tax=Armillaria tabescens TaxID=1929756 RepID=A0AA39MRZ6_ARMTA|nr:uncharacterized protein EV420DRAFT_1484881 [Desarmillaria tabescens]KAK0443660.1 hypothetical protein EV420DRAFT_1484881 [Desarmillaria tabescens]